MEHCLRCRRALGGPRQRALTVVETFTRECVAIEVGALDRGGRGERHGATESHPGRPGDD